MYRIHALDDPVKVCRRKAIAFEGDDNNEDPPSSRNTSFIIHVIHTT